MNSVVYYPYLDPPTDWLRIAALCWERVYTLTTDQRPPRPRDIVDFALEMPDLVQPVDIGQLACDGDTVKQFNEWLAVREATLRHGPWARPEAVPEIQPLVPMVRGKKGKLWPSYGSSPLVQALQDRNLVRTEKWPYAATSPEWAPRRTGPEDPVPTAKITDWADYEEYKSLADRQWDAWHAGDKALVAELKQRQDDLLRRHLFTVADYRDVLYVPADVALHYLSLCAARVAADGNKDLAADGLDFLDAALFGIPNVRGSLATTTLEYYLPESFQKLELGPVFERCQSR